MAKSVKHYKKSMRRTTVKGGGGWPFSSKTTKQIPVSNTKTKEATVGNVSIRSGYENISVSKQFNLVTIDDTWKEMYIIFESQNKSEIETIVNNINQKIINQNKGKTVVNKITTGYASKLGYIEILNKPTVLDISESTLKLRLCKANCNQTNTSFGNKLPLEYDDVEIPMNALSKIWFDISIFQELPKKVGGRKLKTRKNRHNKTRRV